MPNYYEEHTWGKKKGREERDIHSLALGTKENQVTGQHQSTKDADYQQNTVLP